MTKESYFQKAISWVEKRGLYDIKANWDGYETPTQFSRTDEETPFVPDITARATDRKVYVEIALKTENFRQAVSKWKLMSTLASMKGGKLFLLVPAGHKAFVQRMMKKHYLHNTQIVDLN